MPSATGGQTIGPFWHLIEHPEWAVGTGYEPLQQAPGMEGDREMGSLLGVAAAWDRPRPNRGEMEFTPLVGIGLPEFDGGIRNRIAVAIDLTEKTVLIVGVGRRRRRSIEALRCARYARARH